MANQSFTEKLPKFVFRILWLPMGGVLFFLLQSVGGMKGLDAAVIAYPVCLFGQFTLAAAKYSFKASPIEWTNEGRLLCTNILGLHVYGESWIWLVWLVV